MTTSTTRDDAPVRFIPGDEQQQPQEGIGLCLSGGGFRAMLFHAGALWRLNELGYLVKLSRISSVSGGSITAGLLGLKWNRLAFDASGTATRFVDEVVTPIRSLADSTIDVSNIVVALLTPGSIADKVAGPTYSATRRCKTCLMCRDSSSMPPACSRGRCGGSRDRSWPTGASA